jgi:hypothetical protein
MNRSLELKKLDAVLETILEAVSTAPSEGAGREELEEWTNAMIDTIAKKFKEIYAEEEGKKVAAGKE